MYNRKERRWISDCPDQVLFDWAEESAQKNNPRARFLIASELLAQKKDIADAVYHMETSAKAGCRDAMVAMAEMYVYGYGVAKSQRYALDWYTKAAELKDERAIAYLEAIKKKKQRQKRIILVTVVLAVVAVIGGVVLFRQLSMKQTLQITVHEETQLQEYTDMQAYQEASMDLIEAYDDEQTKAGEKSTNRLIVGFDGTKLDLSAYPASMVISKGDGILIIQFDNEADANACYEDLAAREEVRFVEFDNYQTQSAVTIQTAPSTLTRNQYLSWGVEKMGLDELADYILDAGLNREVVVAVIDSGIDVPSDMQDRVESGEDLLLGGDGQKDTNGHGTHVAGTILDTTQGLDVKVIPYRVFDASGSTNSLAICNALELAIAKAPNVINMSLGGPVIGNQYQQELIEEAIDQGIIVVVAAGNGDEYGRPEDTATLSPACIENCIVVGAIDNASQIASFSNYGDSVDVVAPGVDVVSYGINGEETATMSGTSMATPHISAFVSMLCMLYPDASPAQMESYIKIYCTPLGDENYYGDGLPSPQAYIEITNNRK